MVIYTALCTVSVLLSVWSVQEHAALNQPVHWGTYRETKWECSAGR